LARAELGDLEGERNMSRKLALAVIVAASSYLSMPSQVLAQVSPTRSFEQALSPFKHGKLEANGVRYHYVLGGRGDTVVLLHGWGQNWYMWRHVMPKLVAQGYTVIAPDLRGIGDSGKPVGGYDKKTVATDIKSLVDQLNLGQVHIVGHDVGGMVAYSYAAQFQSSVRSLTIVDVPLPGIPPWDAIVANPRTWHFRFYANRDLAESLIAGREKTYFAWFYNSEAVNPAGIDEETLDVYARSYATPGALRGGFEHYRAFEQDAKDNSVFAKTKLTIPVLGVGGAGSFGPIIEQHLKHVAENVRSVSIEGSGHWVADERPAELIEALSKFFANTKK
jgi:pimeloyl-ACP methyl ester carboxylesterase